MAFRKHKLPQKQSTQRKEKKKIKQEIMPKKTKKSDNKNRKENFEDLRYNKYKIMKGRMIVKRKLCTIFCKNMLNQLQTSKVSNYKIKK